MSEKEIRDELLRANAQAKKTINEMESLKSMDEKQVEIFNDLNRVLHEVNPVYRRNMEELDDWLEEKNKSQELNAINILTDPELLETMNELAAGFPSETAHLSQLLTTSKDKKEFTDSYEAWCIHWFGRDTTLEDEEEMEYEVVRIWEVRKSFLRT
ncbi:MAG: hypothetical protein COA73_18745 [Candidatus Hydrogenedentota bacterium]|nr:MAG: hypothetical protein COA73_18745 [Candidatus Hydrogenedentota bacterium]